MLYFQSESNYFPYSCVNNRFFSFPLLRNPADAATGMFYMDIVAVHILYVKEFNFVVVVEVVFIIFLNVSVFNTIDEHLDKDAQTDGVPPELVEELLVALLKYLEEAGFWNVGFFVCWLFFGVFVVGNQFLYLRHFLIGKFHLDFDLVVEIGLEDLHFELVLHRFSVLNTKIRKYIRFKLA